MWSLSTLVAWMYSSMCMSFLYAPSTSNVRVEDINNPTTLRSHCSNGKKKCSIIEWTGTLTDWVSDHPVPPLFSYIFVGPSFSHSYFSLRHCSAASSDTRPPVYLGFLPELSTHQTCSLSDYQTMLAPMPLGNCTKSSGTTSVHPALKVFLHLIFVWILH